MRSAWAMGSLAAAPCQRTAVALSGVDGHRRPVPTPVVVVPEPFPLPGAVGRTRGGRQSATPAAPVAARPGRGDLAGVGVIEVVDAEAGRRALAAGVLRCPCGGTLRAWGHAKPRTVRGLDQTRQVRPDRACCRACTVTHVVLAAGVLPHRGYGLDVIGAALLGAARGHGHRVLAARLKVPTATVRSWLRRARINSDAVHKLGVQTVVALNPELLPTRVGPTRLGEAIAALTAVALAVVRRFGGDERNLWPVIAVVTGGRLLAPAPSSSAAGPRSGSTLPRYARPRVLPACLSHHRPQPLSPTLPPRPAGAAPCQRPATPRRRADAKMPDASESQSAS